MMNFPTFNIKNFIHKEFLDNIKKVIFGTLFGNLIVVASSPIITRLYDPEDFGEASLIVTISTLATLVITLRYDKAIILTESSSSGKLLSGITLLISFLSSTFLLMIVILMDIFFLKNKEFNNYFYFIPLIAFVGSIVSIMTELNNKEKKFKLYANSIILSSGVISFFKIFLCYIFYSHSLFLIISTILGNIATVYKLYQFKTSELFIFYKKYMKKKYIKELLLKYKHFPVYSLPGGLITRLGQSAPIYVLGYFFSLSIVGFYSLAVSILSMPISFVGDAVKRVFIQKSSELANKNKFGELYALHFKITFLLLLLGIFPFSILFIYGEELFQIVFSDNWAEAGKISEYLSFWLLLNFISSPSMASYTVLHMQEYLLKFHIINTILRVSVLIIAILITNDYLLSILLFSIVGILMYLYFIINISIVIRKKKYAI